MKVLDIRARLLDRATSGHVLTLDRERWLDHTADADVVRRILCRRCGGAFTAAMDTATAGKHIEQGFSSTSECLWHRDESTPWAPE